MKSAAARNLFLGVALLGVVLISGACSVSELGLVDQTSNETTDHTIGSRATNASEVNETTGPPPSSEPTEAAADQPIDGTEIQGPAEDEPQAPAGPRLPVDSGLVFRSGTCFQPPFVGAEPEQVRCDEPHRIQVFASRQLPAGPDDEPPSAETAAQVCNEEFSLIAGIGLGLATILDASVLLPSAASWAEGQREVTCYVVFPEPTTQPLTDIDPLRISGLVSIYGLQTGDCLVDLDLAETSFDLVPCDQPHDGEVFATYDLPAGAFPGPELIESLASNLCFGQGFTDFIGLPFSDSVINALQSAPTAETWALGHHRISCITTDGLIRTDSLAGAAR